MSKKPKNRAEMAWDVVSSLGPKLKSGKYRDKVAAVVQQHFVPIWNPEFQLPRADKVRFTMYEHPDTLSVRVRFDLCFESWRDLYEVYGSIPFDWTTFTSEEELQQQILSVVPQLMENLCDEVEDALPSEAEEILRSHVRYSREKLEGIPQELEKHPDVRMMLKEMRPAIRASYETRLAEAPCPPAFQPLHVASLSMRCKTSGNTGVCTLQIKMDGGVYSRDEVSFDLNYCHFYQTQERRREVLLGLVRENLEILLQQAVHMPLLYICPGYRVLAGMTEPLLRLLQEGRVSLGCVTVQWDGPHMEDTPLLYRLQQDGGKLYLRIPRHAVSECPAVPLKLDALQQQTVPLQEMASMPQDLAGLFRLGEALRDAVEKASQAKTISPPSILLQADRDFQLSISWRTRKFRLDGSAKSAGDVAAEIVDQVCRAEADLPQERKAQLQLLNSLNPTELAVLRYITDNGEIWYHALADQLEYQVITTKVYTGACLDRLAELEIPVDGTMVHLLCYRMVEGNYSQFRMYNAEARIDPAVRRAAVGRPFAASEAEQMKPEARGQWFTQYLLEAGEEQRWTRFNEALEHMPGTFLAAFARSEAGQAFLRTFTGADAMFARLTVEGLPGCKRLAAKIWPEEQERLTTSK